MEYRQLNRYIGAGIEKTVDKRIVPTFHRSPKSRVAFLAHSII